MHAFISIWQRSVSAAKHESARRTSPRFDSSHQAWTKTWQLLLPTRWAPADYANSCGIVSKAKLACIADRYFRLARSPHSHAVACFERGTPREAIVTRLGSQFDPLHPSSSGDSRQPAL
ncbi:hypothetical protein LSAT2_029426 [Lamellibrachia satsuma]|nr:hypothetical protein LSAT2_029426 [Lamellibrachia satsuma]